MKAKNVHFIVFDLKKALYSLRFYFIPIVLIAVLNFAGIKSYKNFSIIDGLAVFFKGMRPFQYVDGRSVFDIPKLLVVFVFYVVFTSLNYVNRERSHSNFNTALRFVSRRNWMIGKIFTSVWLTLLQLILFYFSSWSLFRGNQIHLKELSQWIFQIDLSPNFLENIGFFLFITIPVVLVSLTLLSLVLLFYFGFSFAICFLLLLLVSSTYFNTSFLVGNLLMLHRTNLVESLGISLLFPTVACAIFTGIAASVLVFKSNKWEIFK